ncbi:uncharacterized protein LOC129944694 [Eupeodes corollae]|uniref:uncharacterized protein LOC129944694 n=1 Tax=Eupeodes corollae TaxID=290404 RepID=UPI002491F42F|nr:uncharacterized protein LOC129944694 [Eupeodes corollae]
MEVLATLTLLALAITISFSLPTELINGKDLKPDIKYASRLSQLIATNLLKDNMEIDGNNVYSPLGVATILAILGEASDGETYNEFVTSLNAPSSKQELRQSFKNILNNIQTSSSSFSLNPSFKTWFYIYRNYTAREEFKQILSDYYCVEVKDINNSTYNWDEPSISLDSPPESSSISNSKDVIGFETLKKLNSNVEEQRDEIADAEPTKKASKFDKFVDDKQYLEVPLIKEEIAREKLQKKKEEENKSVTKAQDENKNIYNLESDKTKLTSTKYEDQNNIQENETVQDEEKMDSIQKNLVVAEETQPEKQPIDQESNEPHKLTLPLQKLEEGGSDIIQALGSHFNSKRLSEARSPFGKDDIASALSANSINGRDSGSRTKMLLFNGLYYRGNWAYPFEEVRSSPNEIFHLTSDQSLQIQTMHARGKYLVADLEAYNACGVSLPYENKRYSLLIVMPKDVEGLHNLIENFNSDIFSNFKNVSSEKDIYLSIPKFQVEETSRSEAMLKNLGLQKIFVRGAADLGLLSKDTDLHVDEIVQFVSVRVDEGGSVQNGFSATSNVGRTLDGVAQQKIEVNRPFLYFVMDTEEDFVIVAGKITVPQFKAHLDVDIDVEYAQS